MAVKKERKAILAALIKKETGIEIDTNSIIDVQAKRLHAYKRQLLNILHVMYLYQRMKEDKSFRITPHTFVFAAKAAEKASDTTTVADNFVESFYDENGVFNGIKFKIPTFNGRISCFKARFSSITNIFFLDISFFNQLNKFLQSLVVK